MTEGEAKTKWCPFARLGFSDTVGTPAVNRMLDVKDRSMIDNMTKCIGSDCMVWRWHYMPGEFGEYCEGNGYCGLAGKT